MDFTVLLAPWLRTVAFTSLFAAGCYPAAIFRNVSRHESCRRLSRYAHTWARQARGVSVCSSNRATHRFHTGTDLSGSNPWPRFLYHLFPLSLSLSSRYLPRRIFSGGWGVKGTPKRYFFAGIHTYLRASVSSSCTWNTRDACRSTKPESANKSLDLCFGTLGEGILLTDTSQLGTLCSRGISERFSRYQWVFLGNFLNGLILGWVG